MDPAGPPRDASTAATPNQASDSAAQRTILLAEYAAMRAEITTLLSLQGQFLNFSIVLFGFVVAMSNRAGGMPSDYVPLLPIPFGVLGLSYADVAFRIMRAARYIHHEVRPRLNTLGGDATLDWEAYIRERHPNLKLMNWMDRLRWSFFLGPAVGFTVLSFLTRPPTSPPWWTCAAWTVSVAVVVLNLIAVNRVSRLAKQVTEA